MLWVAMLGAMAPPGRRVLRTHESGGDGASKRQTPLEHVDSHKLRAILLRKKGKRDWQAACDTLWWAIEHEPEEVQPIHFNIVLASLAAATEWERCLVLLEHDMPRSGLRVRTRARIRLGFRTRTLTLPLTLSARHAQVRAPC